jgi:dCMP deaminase
MRVHERDRTVWADSFEYVSFKGGKNGSVHTVFIHTTVRGRVVCGMKDPEKLWLDMVVRFSQQSKCRSRQVGAVLVYDGHMFGQGWNGAPAGSSTDNCPRPRCAHVGLESGSACSSGSNLDQVLCTHAEINALLNAARAGRRTLGATLYCTTYPCGECAKAIVTAGIYEVVFLHEYNSPLTKLIFDNANMKVRRFNVGTD